MVGALFFLVLFWWFAIFERKSDFYLAEKKNRYKNIYETEGTEYKQVAAQTVVWECKFKVFSEMKGLKYEK